MVNVSAWGMTQYTLGDLKPNVEYGIMVRAMSLTMEGPQSKMITGRPNSNGKSSFIISNTCMCSLPNILWTMILKADF